MGAPKPQLQSICVFCGSRQGARPEYLEAATALGAELARRGIGLVYGGASVGTMGALADGALAAGGKVTGVIPRALVDRELAHPALTELRVVHSMHERKATMEKLSDGFIALPGGFGTFEELFEVITWAQLGLHHKPVGLLSVCAYFDSLRHLMRRGVHEGFIAADHADAIIYEDDPARLVDRLLTVEVPQLGPKVIDRRET